jgi:type VI protein secretion system component VasK
VIVALRLLLLAVAGVLTRVELLFAFDDLQHFAPGAVLVLAVRNLVLVAAAYALWKASTGRASGRPTRWAWPSRS